MTSDHLKIGISCYPTYGGSGIVATELGKELARRGHEVHFITYALPSRLDRFQERVFFHEVETPEYPLFEYSPYSLALASVMAETAKNAGLDLIHAHYAIPHAASAYLAKEMIGGKLKIITTLHGTDITLVGNQPSFLNVVKFSIERSDAVTAVSNWLAEETSRKLGVKREIAVISNFIDPAVFRRREDKAMRRKLAHDNQTIMMHISNFRPVKRPEDLIKVLELVRKDADAVLVLIGDGPMRSRVEGLCREKRLSEQVIFLGKQFSVVELLSLADVYLCTSEAESFGLSALEALACGVPVVSTGAGGVPEVIEDGQEGFLIPVGGVETMAEKVLTLVKDKNLWLKMRKAGRETAEKKFNIADIVNRYEHHYYKMLYSQ